MTAIDHDHDHALAERDRIVCLSIDLDEIGCYRAIHGLDDAAGPGAPATPIYDRGVPRFAELLARHGVRATFFAVGRDAGRPAAAARLRELVAAGHEISNHTLSHMNDLARRNTAVMVAEVAGGRTAIEDAVGAPAVGFRAPGYTLGRALVDVLADQRVAYDSSVLPSPAYFLARAGAILLKSLRGRRSRSLPGGIEMGLAPRHPYRLGRPFFLPARGSAGGSGEPAGVPELPIAVLPGLRIPFIGTTLVLAGPRRAVWMCRLIERQPFVNLELHGIDLCGPDDPGVGGLRGHQPDAAIPVFAKTATLDAVISRFRSKGARFATLREAAAVLFYR